MIFVVLWKLPGGIEHRDDFDAPDIKALLKMLDRSEGVNEETAQKLYVHQLLPNGKVIEHLHIDRAVMQSVNKYPTVIETVKKVLKKVTQDESKRITHGIYYHAYPAPAWEEK